MKFGLTWFAICFVGCGVSPNPVDGKHCVEQRVLHDGTVVSWHNPACEGPSPSYPSAANDDLGFVAAQTDAATEPAPSTTYDLGHPTYVSGPCDMATTTRHCRHHHHHANHGRDVDRGRSGHDPDDRWDEDCDGDE